MYSKVDRMHVEQSISTCLLRQTSAALKGSLVVLSTMMARPLKFSSECKVLDLFKQRPQTKFSNDVQSLHSLGLSTKNAEHAFFLRSYMQFLTDPSFCKDGVLDNCSAVISLPPGGANARRASVLKRTLKRFRKLFHTQTSCKTTTSVPNSSLNQKQGGGLDRRETLPGKYTHCWQTSAQKRSIKILQYHSSLSFSDTSKTDWKMIWTTNC
jgi:hypothetical protein